MIYFSDFEPAAGGGGGGGDVPAPTDFSVPGAWTWFNDPRAIAVDEGIVAGTITTAGDLIAYELGDGTPVDLHGSTLQVDDHANPSFLLRSSDNRILAFASAHNGPSLYTYLSTNPGDAAAFGAETDIDSQLGRSDYSYPNPVQLTGETNDPIYLFFRALGASSTRQYYYSTSTDQGATWSAATELFTNNNDSLNNPPYVKVVQNGTDRIDFFLTDGHPEFTATNSIYHCYYQGGAFRKTDGTTVTLPINPAVELTQVYSGATNRAWIWDAAINGSGEPVCVFAVFNSTTDHRYRFAKLTAGSWGTAEICTAGRYLYAGQAYYSGGIAIDPDDVDTVFASRFVDGVPQIFRHTFSGTWSAGTRITGEARAFRPYVVRNASAEPRLLYLKGEYTSFTDYNTTVELVDSTASPSLPTDSQRANVVLHVRAGTTADVSPVARTLTWGASVTETGDKLNLPGTSVGVITAPDAADLTLAGDFTIEIFGAEFDTPTALHKMISKWRAAAGQRGWQVAYQGDLTPDQLGIYLSTDGTANQFNEASWTPAAATPYNLCFERSSNDVRVYVNGTMLSKETYSAGAVRDNAARMIIGTTEDAAGAISTTGMWDGRFKEIRVTANDRYANDAGYSVPSIPLPTS